MPSEYDTPKARKKKGLPLRRRGKPFWAVASVLALAALASADYIPMAVFYEDGQKWGDWCERGSECVSLGLPEPPMSEPPKPFPWLLLTLIGIVLSFGVIGAYKMGKKTLGVVGRESFISA